MECFRNRGQLKQAVKILFVAVIVSAMIYWIIHFSNNADEELKTCEPTISVKKMGQFGNQIWEYISLYVVWQMNFQILKHHNITPYIEEEMKINLEDLFENLIIPSFPKNCQHYDERDTIIIPKEIHFNLPNNMDKKNVLLDSYSARYEDTVKFGIDNIKKELRFKEHYVEDVMKTFEDIKARYHLQHNETTFVGMHYRGGDYIPHLQGNHGDLFKGPPNYTYYTAAMDYFKAKFENIIFILISIDDDWLYQNARKIQEHGNVVLNPFTNDRNRDLTLLAHCNHSIISYGTFGVTTALFAQGETILYDLDLPIDYRGDTVALGLSKILPHWIIMKNLRENVT